MKVSIAIAVSLSLFTTSVGVFATHTNAESVHVISAKEKDLFVFKVSKSWHGASVEVVAANGDFVSRQRLMKRKMIINFCDVKEGTYKIRISKEGHTEEFQYIKK
jgi:hypothetical protein